MTYDDQFPIDVFQTGSGTSSNMNVNEVLATLADRGARLCRCTPTTGQRVAVVQRRVPVLDPPGRDRGARRSDLIPALDHLASTLDAKADRLGRAW